MRNLTENEIVMVEGGENLTDGWLDFTALAGLVLAGNWVGGGVTKVYLQNAFSNTDTANLLMNSAGAIIGMGVGYNLYTNGKLAYREITEG